MALIVGENAYCNVEEANTLIADNCISTSKEVEMWSKLNNKDKEILIISATQKYDNSTLNYKGIKFDKSQSLEFPRLLNGVKIECPDEVALGYIILGLYDYSQSSSQFNELMDSGVKSFADGSGARVEFDTESLNKNKYSVGINKIISTYFDKYRVIGLG